ncbi:MAG: coproporphyrinogen III oxidase, partial [Frankiaceae bacterium]|nr:coproporphyrinogen III oxidase [Frankiaceae bacterium]
VSNWARDDSARSKHNLLYWTDADWWGFGPGAHSHLDGVRWWNVKHPTTYAERLAAGESAAQDREVLTDAERHMENVMLRVRLRDGLPLDLAKLDDLDALRDAGFLTVDNGRAVLTRQGRLLANTVIARLLD